MKKLLLILTAFLAISLQAQDPLLSISGTVTDISNPNAAVPIPNHLVEISIDSTNTNFTYSNDVYTSPNGFYFDDIGLPGDVFFGILTLNSIDPCNMTTQSVSIFFLTDSIGGGFTTFTHDFEFCGGPTGDCDADFEYASSPANPLNIAFTDLSAGNINNWQWDFGDGNGSFEQNPVHTYGGPGIYPVCLTVTGDSLCYDLFCMDVVVDSIIQPDCNAFFSYDYIPDFPTFILFEDLSTGNISSWQWSFGDGTGSSEQNPIHEYEDLGIYQVCLTVMGDSLCFDTFCMDVYVDVNYPGNCLAYFDFFTDPADPFTFYFIDSSLLQIDSWQWDFGDGNTSTEQFPVHTYNAADTFLVCLVASSSFYQCSDTICKTVVTGDCPPCIAEFDYLVDPADPYTFQFIDLSGGSVGEYFWEFGDSTFSTLQNPIHTFTTEGNYMVCLTVTSTCSYCADTYCEEIIVAVSQTFSLGGTVLTDSIPIDEGFAYAYRLENGQIVDVDASLISEFGYYDFFQMQGGDYIVKAELSPNSVLFGQYLPTYFGNVAHWGDATVINLQNNFWNADISLIEVEGVYGGTGTITGAVWYDAQRDDPVSDVEVILKDQNENISGVAFTNENGYFTFKNLPMGDYQVMVEMTGKNAVPALLTLDEAYPDVDNISFIVKNSEIVLSVDNDMPAYISFISEVYPNPARQNATIDIAIEKPSEVSISLFSVTGQQLFESYESLSQGTHTKSLNTSGLRQGIYYLKVGFDANYVVTKKIVIIN